MAIAKVFRIELQGGREVQKDVNDLKKVITTMGAAIKTAKAELSQLLQTKGDPVAIENLRKKLVELEKQLKSTQTEAQKEAIAQRALSQALIAQAKERQAVANALKAEENARKAKIQADKAEESQTRRNTQANQALAGSYTQIKAQLAQLRPFVQSGGFGGTIAFNGQTLNFQQAIDEFKRLSFAEQDFRRQFQKDGTIVGEYAQGIVNAFNRLGIDDIIKNQVTGARQELERLEQNTKDLVVAYRQAQQAGTGDLNKLEKEIHDNVVETQKLSKSIKDAEIQLKGVGGVGTRITTALKENFKDLKNSIAQFALGFLGFQALFSGIQKTFSEVVALDSLDASLKVVSGSSEELARNQEFLLEVTDRLGLVYTDTALAFKNFFAASTQAGISADETRQIFESATSATSALKLSQEQTNGVLLAFGQIASKGKVQAEELRGQIGERIPGAFSIAARAIGVTQQELNKMLEQGQVMADDFLPKFATELRKTFGGDSTKNVEGLQASVNRLKNEFTALIQDNQSGLSSFFSILINAITFLIRNIPVIITLIGLYAAGWAMANKQMIIQRGLLIAQRTLLPIVTLLLGGQANALRLYAGATALAARGLAFLSNLMANPIFRVFAALLGVSVAALTAFGRSTAAAASSMDTLSQKTKFMAEAQTEANKQVAETIAKEQSLLAIIKDRTLADETRQRALDQLKTIMGEYGKALTLENVLTAEGTKAIAAYNEELLRRGRITASQNIATRENQKLQELITQQFDVESAIKSKGVINTGQLSEDVLEAYYKATGRTASAIGQFLGDKVGIDFTYKGEDLKKFSDIIKKRIDQQLTRTTAAELAKLENEGPSEQGGAKVLESVFQVFKRLVDTGGTEQDFKDLLRRVQDQMKNTKLLSKEYKDLRKLEEDIKNLIDPKKASGRGSRLSGGQKDQFKDIDAARDQQLADEAIYFENRFETEKEYLQQIRDINIGAIDEKLKLLDGSNAEERKKIAEFNLEKIKLARDTAQKLFDIDSKAIEIEQRNAILSAQLVADAQNLNPELSEEGRLMIKDEFMSAQLQAQIVFNQKQIELEKKYAIQSVENEQKRKEAIEKLQKELQENLRAIPAAKVKDIQTRGADTSRLIDIQTADQTTGIVTSSESARKQAMQLQELQSQAAKKQLQNEVETARQILKVKEDALAQGLIAEREYLDALTDFKTKEAALYKLTANEQISSTERLVRALKGVRDAFLENVFGIKQYTKDASGEAQRVEDLINSTLANVQKAITTAYNLVFEKEADRIERSKENQIAFLEREKERVLAQAQSEDERATIERQYEQKRKDEEKKAFEAKKKLAIKQATIDFALAAIKTFAQFGWPLGLIGVAGLAVAYGAQLASIKAQQFAKGGKVEPLGNGKINAPSNIPTQRNGDNVLATVRSGEVILNQRQQAALGGARTFKKIGVPGFAGGGQVPDLGRSLRAPEFVSSSSVSAQAAQGEERMLRLESLTEQVLQAVYASDKKPVVLNPNQVTEAQRRKQKDISVATI